MPEYTVVWQIDIEANTPLEAAIEAEKFHQNSIYRPCFQIAPKVDRGDCLDPADGFEIIDLEGLDQGEQS